jgi:acyl-CoA reductase-like NAD-dependent aldehyde dehydrogenase
VLKLAYLVSFTGSEALAGSSARACNPASAKCCSSSAATTVRFAFRAPNASTLIIITSHQPAAIVMPDADLDLAVPAVFFGAVGTAGQRCTSTRRLYLHRTIAPEFLARLQKLYAALQPGDPLDARTLLGPLHTRAAVRRLRQLDRRAPSRRRAHTSSVAHATTEAAGGNFVRPTIDPRCCPSSPRTARRCGRRSDSRPCCSLRSLRNWKQAIVWNNAVPQGLSSSLWTRDVRNVGKWIGPAGSDAGIVNVRFRVPYPHHPLFLLLNVRTGQRWHKWSGDWCRFWREQGLASSYCNCLLGLTF